MAGGHYQPAMESDCSHSSAHDYLTPLGTDDLVPLVLLLFLSGLLIWLPLLLSEGISGLTNRVGRFFFFLRKIDLICQ